MIADLQNPPHQTTTVKPKANSIGVSPILTELTYVKEHRRFHEAQNFVKRLVPGLWLKRAMVEYGPNVVAMEKQPGRLSRLFKETRTSWSF